MAVLLKTSYHIIIDLKVLIWPPNRPNLVNRRSSVIIPFSSIPFGGIRFTRIFIFGSLPFGSVSFFGILLTFFLLDFVGGFIPFVGIPFGGILFGGIPFGFIPFGRIRFTGVFLSSLRLHIWWAHLFAYAIAVADLMRHDVNAILGPILLVHALRTTVEWLLWAFHVATLISTDLDSINVVARFGTIWVIETLLEANLGRLWALLVTDDISIFVLITNLKAHYLITTGICETNKLIGCGICDWFGADHFTIFTIIIAFFITHHLKAIFGSITILHAL